jgi:hypothetical protein
MATLLLWEIIKREYEEAKQTRCYICAGLGYILDGASLERAEVTVCECKIGRALQTATHNIERWFFRLEHCHDQGLFDGRPTPAQTLPPVIDE